MKTVTLHELIEEEKTLHDELVRIRYLIDTRIEDVLHEMALDIIHKSNAKVSTERKGTDI